MSIIRSVLSLSTNFNTQVNITNKLEHGLFIDASEEQKQNIISFSFSLENKNAKRKTTIKDQTSYASDSEHMSEHIIRPYDENNEFNFRSNFEVTGNSTNTGCLGEGNLEGVHFF